MILRRVPLALQPVGTATPVGAALSGLGRSPRLPCSSGFVEALSQPGLRHDNEGFFTRIALAAECEWGAQDQSYYEFEKLLLARADLRVMVFDGNRLPGYAELFRIFAQYIGWCAHTEAGDVWMFAA